MRIKTTCFIFALLLVLPGALLIGQNSQKKSGSGVSSYKTGIGLRFGYESGLTVKHFLGENAIEGILSRGWGYGGLRITGLYEFQRHINAMNGLDWFVGIGAHIGFYRGDYYGYRAVGNGYYDRHGHWHPDGYRRTYTTFGLDGILGLEYVFTEVPFSLSLDIKPYFDIIGRGEHFADGALSFRYTIR